MNPVIVPVLGEAYVAAPIATEQIAAARNKLVGKCFKTWYASFPAICLLPYISDDPLAANVHDYLKKLKVGASSYMYTTKIENAAEAAFSRELKGELYVRLSFSQSGVNSVSHFDHGRKFFYLRIFRSAC